MVNNDIRKQIINTAGQFFSKYGFNKTTMDEIAKYIHKAKGVLYYYFKSKEELFNEVLKQELSNAKIELSKIVNSEMDFLSIMKQYFLMRLKLLSKASNYHETLKADFFEKYYFVKDVRDDFFEFERVQLTYILNKGKNEGYDIKDINSTVSILLMIENGIEIPLYLQNKYEEYESTINDLVSMIANSMKHKA